jgi:cytochrome P450
MDKTVLVTTGRHPSGRSTTEPPGPRSPGAWQLARFTLDFVRYLEACADRYGEVFTLRPHGLDALVVATGPAEVHAVLTDRDRFAGGEAAQLLEPVTGRASVILAGGAQHMRQRKRLLAPFHGERITRWRDEIGAIAARELAQLPLEEPVAMRPAMQRLTLEVICRIVFGMDDPDRIAEFRAAVTRFLDPRLSCVLFVPTLTRRTGRLNPARTFIARRAEVRRLLDEEIAPWRADRGRRDDVLSLLLDSRDEDGAPLDDLDVRDELMGLLIAGHETTATGLAWAFERLSRTPAANARFAADGDGDGAYVDAVVRETLRTRPPVIDAVRTAVTDTTLGGQPIRAGTLVSAMFCITHRRADLWPDPLAFRPERFLDDKPAPYAYTPFGGGIRRCIGAALATLEMRVVLDTARRRLTLAPAPGPQERMRLSGVTLIPSRGGELVLRER